MKEFPRNNSSSNIPDIPKPDFDFDLINGKQSSSLSPIVGIVGGDIITCSQLATMLTNPIMNKYDRILIVDARYSYEFQGGRISGAVNITSRASMLNFFNKYKNQNVCVVFHCEFSHNRGPDLLREFRNFDRNVNIKDYPHLCFPHIFLLEGGYKKFHSLYPQLCKGGYVNMRDKRFVGNGEIKKCHSQYFSDMVEEKHGKVKRQMSLQLSFVSSISGPFQLNKNVLSDNEDIFKESQHILPLSSSQPFYS